MMKKTVLILLSLLLIITLLSACGGQKGEQPQGGTGTYADYIDAGKRIAAEAGDVYARVAKDLFKAKEAPEYASVADMLEALRMGRVDAVLISDGYVKQLQDSGMYPDFDYLYVPTDVYVNEAGPIFYTEELRDKYNEWFETIKADGTWQDMVDRWIRAGLPAQEDIPQFELTGENGTLKMCDTGNYPPLIYFDANNEPAGFDVEIMSRFAQHMGMDLEITMMAYEAIVPYVISGKADMSACTLTITEEREDSIIFGSPSVITQAVLIVPKTEKTELDYTDFIGKKLGHKTGSFWDQVLPEHLNAELAYYTEASAGLEDVRKGRIDGYVTDLSAVRALVASAGNEDLTYVVIPAEFFEAPMGAVSIDQDIVDRFNVFLAEIESDGTLADMKNRWLENVPDLDSPMPDIPLPGTNGTLKVATTAGALPFSYMGADSELKGYSIELALRFAAHEGMDVDFAEMEFGGMIPYVISGKADFAIADISITEERKQSVLFTDSIFDDQGGIIVLKKDGGEVAPAARSYANFEGKKLGTVTGSVYEGLNEAVLHATTAHYSEISAGIEDVRKGRIDGFTNDLSSLKVLLAYPGNEDLDYIEVPEEFFSAPMGGISTDQDIIDRFNSFLADISADGTLTEMKNRWLGGVADLDAPMPDIKLTGENGTLRVATRGGGLPFAYIGENGEFKGYSIELVTRFAAREGLDIEFFEMEFSALIPYVISGKADIGIADIMITEERKQSVLFTDPIYNDLCGILILKQSGETSAKRDYTWFEGKNIASITGVLTYITTEKIGGTPVYYSDSSAAAEDVRQGRVSGFMHALSTVRAIAAQEGNEDFETFAVPKEYFSAQVAGISMDQDVIDSFNEFLAVVKSDGTLDNMQKRWFGETLDLNAPMPDIPNTGENGVIKIATCGDALPYAYAGAGGELNGFSVELALRYAAHIGKTVEFADVEFGGLINYIVSGKADISIANMAITEERKQSVLFTEPFFDEQHGILALKLAQDTKAEATDGGFIAWIKRGIEHNLITDNRWKMVVNGLGVTMTISLAAQLLGTVFGCFVCYLLTRKNRLVKGIGNFYCGLIHGTPIVVLLMITYYIIFGSASISNVLVAIAAFTMVEGAIIAQNLKGAIETVDPVEIEAARSIGFPAFKAFKTVTLPQAVRRALPAYTNGFVELVKATAIVGYIAIQDLTRAGDIIRSRTYDPYFPLLFVAVIYLIVTTICVQIFKLIVKRVSRGADSEVKTPKTTMVKSAMDYKAMFWTTPKNMK